MNKPRVLSKSISSLLVVGFAAGIFPDSSAQAAVRTWDGGGVGGTDFGTPVNWSDDLLPDAAVGDTALWDGTVAGPLSLIYSNAAFAGVAGNQGINLSLASTQTSSLNIDTGTNTGVLRMNGVTIAAGAGAFSLGNGANTFNVTLGGAGGQTHTWTNDSSNAAVIASDVVVGLGGGGAHTLALGGTGNWTFNNAIGQGTGTLTLTKSGAGTLTLTGANTYTGGLVLNAGTLNFNNAGAAGNTATGALTINGGTLDNSTGGAITTTTAKAQNWNGDFTFTGTQNLNFNTGTVTLGGAGTARSVNVNAGTLQIGNLVGAGYGLTKTGAGTLALNSATLSRITGTLNVAGGKIQIAQSSTTTQDFVVGGLTGSGTVEAGNSVTRWLFVDSNADNTFSGVLQNGSSGALGLAKRGTGTLTLTGVNTYTSQTTAGGGVLEFGSSSTAGITQTVGNLVFSASDAAVKSSFNGTGTASLTFLASEARTAGATGNFIISGGTNGTTNAIRLTKAAGFLDQGTFLNGSNYAWMDGANTFVRAINYNGVEGVTSGATTSLAAATHQEFTGNVSAQASATFTTLKDAGNNNLTLDTGATLTTNGLLKTGNVAGGATVSGGTGIQAATGAELVIRTDGANDSLTIATPILANGASTLTTSGAGTLTLSAANTFTGLMTVNSKVNLSGSLTTPAVNVAGGGTLNLTGSINSANVANGLIIVGSNSGGNAVLNIDGGTLRATSGTNPALRIAAAANSNGFIKMTSGTLSSVNQFNIGNGQGAHGSNPYAAFTMSGGTVTSGSWLVVGAANDRAVLNQSGGTLTVSTNRMTIGAGGATSIGVANFSGGTFSSPNGAFIGENGTGIMNVSGAADVTIPSLLFANNATSIAGTINLLGGTLNSLNVAKAAAGTGVYRFNFNGGTLRPTASSTTFFPDSANTEAYVYAGNAIFDTNGFDVTVAEQLRAPTGSGLSSIAVGSGGVGYLDTPVVTVSGGTGIGAQAVANVSGGVVTGFTITNPGSGYSPGDVLDVALFGGGATTPAAVGTVTLAASSTTGGLIKNGAGTLTLSGASTYTGNVQINGGTVVGAFTNIGNPTTSAFGNATVAGRTITVASGATLRLTANDSFGNQLAVPANLPSLIINGNFVTTSYNQIGAITLNGATMTASNAGGTANYQNFQFLGDVTVGGSAPSLINTTVGAGIDGNHLNTLTTFTVADVTGNANTDLTVSAHFRDRSNNYGLSSGSLIKAGAGTMELTNTNTYTGSTEITGGTLRLSGTGSINSSGAITINGSGAKLLQTSSSQIFPLVLLNDGTIDGTGSIGTVNVADLASNTIANGNGTLGAALTIDSLTFNGAAKISLLSSTILAPLITTNLSSGTGTITIDATNASWNNGSVYDLVSYSGGIGGTGFSAFTKGVITGIGARQSATLGNSGTAITLTIAGDRPLWTGSGNDTWTTAIQSPKNWKLETGGTATDFLTSDSVLFEDTQSVQTSVIIGQNVSPVSTNFNNTTKTYTVTSPGGFGIASGSLTKDGTGILNLGGAHTYTGPTLLNAGTTNVTGTLGNTAVTVAIGATLNLQAANAISQNTLTVNGTLAQSVANALSGTAAVVLNDGATLAQPNSHSGGTTLNNGTLNLGNGAAIGTGLFTINGGTIDNISGGSLTLTNNNPVHLTTDLNFTGTNALHFGTGAVSLGNNTPAQTINIFNNSTLPGTSLTFGGTVSGTGGTALTLNIVGGDTAFTGSVTTGTASSLVVNDTLAGTLTLSGPASSFRTLNMEGGASSVVNIGSGNLTLANGGGNILQSNTGGTINGSGTVTIGGAGGDFGTAGGTTLTVNAKLAGINTVDFWNNNGGAGFGTIELTAANTHTGGVNIQNTKIVIPASGIINANNTANSGEFRVGDTAALAAQLDLNGGTINATKTVAPSFSVGVANGAIGTVNMTSGTINAASEVWLSNGAGGQAIMNMSGGQVNTGSWFVVGRNLGTGTLNLSGGTITKGAAGGYIILGSLGGTGTLNQTGGALDALSNGIRLGENTGTTPALNTLWDMQSGTSTVTGEINVGWRSSQATWNVSGNSVVTATGRLIVGAETANNTINTGVIVNGAPVGTVNISGNSSVSFAGADSRIGGDNSAVSVGATGTVNVSGGTLNFANNVQVGAYGKGFLNISGTGVVNATGGFPSVGRFVGGVGEMNVTGGTFTHTGAGLFIIGEEGTGTLSINSGSVSTVGLRLGQAATGNGTVNLNGGTLSAASIQKTVAGSTAAFKLNGGTLRTTAANADLFLGFPAGSVTVESGGAVIDTNGFDSTIAQALVPGTAGGGLTKNGDGTLTLAATNSYTGATTVNDGTLAFGASQTLSSLVIADGATVVLGATPAPAASGDEPVALLGLPEAASASSEIVESGESQALLASANVLGGLDAFDSSGVVDGGAVQMAAVPEPGAVGLLLAGALGLMGRRRRQAHRAA